MYWHTSTQDFKPKIIHLAGIRLSFECFVYLISDGAPTKRTVLFVVYSVPLCEYCS
jgi:hypothetical protein